MFSFRSRGMKRGPARIDLLHAMGALGGSRGCPLLDLYQSQGCTSQPISPNAKFWERPTATQP
jgi:hypothetical protein